jgi:hypothetical protein
MTKIILEVDGGIVKNVIADGPIEYVLVDWDNLEAGDEFPEMEDFRGCQLTSDIEKSLIGLQIDNILKNGENEKS